MPTLGRPHRSEVSAIESHDEVRIKAICQDDRGRITRAQRNVGVPIDEFGDQRPILISGRFDREASEFSHEGGLTPGTEPSPDEIRRLGNHECRDDQVQIATAQDLSGTDMVRFRCVRCRDKRARVKDRDRTHQRGSSLHTPS